MLRFKFTRSARRHRIGKGHAMAALRSGAAPTVTEDVLHQGELFTVLEWIATDDRGVELNVIGRISREDADLVIVYHVMPTNLKEQR